jgi:hypothetical protein
MELNRLIWKLTSGKKSFLFAYIVIGLTAYLYYSKFLSFEFSYLIIIYSIYKIYDRNLVFRQERKSEILRHT